MKSLFALLLALFPVAAAAQPYDAVVGGGVTSGCFSTPPGFDPAIQWVFGGTGGITDYGDLVAAAPQSRVLASVGYGGGVPFRLSFVEPNASTPFGESPSDYDALSIAAARSGAVYVLAENTPSGQSAIIAFDPSGAIAGVHPLPSLPSAAGIDLAADQCTLWIAAEDRVSRYDVCTSTLLSDFTAGTAFTGVRILPDGGAVLIQDGVLRRYSAAGALVQSYVVPGVVGAIGLADGGSRVLAAPFCTEELVMVRLDSGASEVVADTGIAHPRAVVAYTSWTAALGSSHIAAVPTGSTYMLLLLGITVVTAALLRLR